MKETVENTQIDSSKSRITIIMIISKLSHGLIALYRCLMESYSNRPLKAEMAIISGALKERKFQKPESTNPQKGTDQLLFILDTRLIRCCVTSRH